MKTLFTSLLTFAVLATASTTALAGGDDNGGAKDDGQIVVENDFEGYVMAVAISDEAPDTVSEFLAQGAQFVQPGDSVSFDVAGGSHTVTALFIQDVAPYDIITDTLNVNVEDNDTTTVVGVEPGELQED